MAIKITSSGPLKGDTYVEGEVNGKKFVAVDTDKERNLGPWAQDLTDEELKEIQDDRNSKANR